MITLYAPEKPQPPHKCETGMYVAFEPPKVLHGAVIQCKTCARLWYADVAVDHATDRAMWSVFWRKVRWYHFDLKKKARENG